MYVCILDAAGNVVVHKDMAAGPDAFLRVIAPYRENVVVAVECIFTWYWLADLCVRENIAFVLGHALYMKAIHGGKAKNDRIDAHKIAVLLRGGMIPMAYVYPRAMRSTRDLLRRRCRFARQRAGLLAHIQNTTSQYNLAALPKRISYKANRTTVPDHFPDPEVRKSIEADLLLIDHYDELLTDLELHLVRTAKIHDADTFYRLRSVPGIGKILALVMLYEIHDIGRFPTVGDFLSYARLVKCSKESAGKHYGYGGAKIGSVYLKWAFSEAATLFLRNNGLGQAYFARLQQKYGNAKGRSVLAHKLGRAVYFMLSHRTAFDLKKFVGKATPPLRLAVQAQADDTASVDAPHTAAESEAAACPASPPRSARALAQRAAPAKPRKKKNDRTRCPRSDDLEGGKGVATPHNCRRRSQPTPRAEETTATM
jgi:transposase